MRRQKRVQSERSDISLCCTEGMFFLISNEHFRWAISCALGIFCKFRVNIIVTLHEHHGVMTLCEGKPLMIYSFPHKGPTMQKEFPYHNVLMNEPTGSIMIIRQACDDLNPGAPFPARIYNCIHYIKCGMKLVIHSQTSTVQPLKFGNG